VYDVQVSFRAPLPILLGITGLCCSDELIPSLPRLQLAPPASPQLPVQLVSVSPGLFDPFSARKKPRSRSLPRLVLRSFRPPPNRLRRDFQSIVPRPHIYTNNTHLYLVHDYSAPVVYYAVRLWRDEKPLFGLSNLAKRLGFCPPPHFARFFSASDPDSPSCSPSQHHHPTLPQHVFPRTRHRRRLPHAR
jgi:hypothetical protein